MSPLVLIKFASAIFWETVVFSPLGIAGRFLPVVIKASNIFPPLLPTFEARRRAEHSLRMIFFQFSASSLRHRQRQFHTLIGGYV